MAARSVPFVGMTQIKKNTVDPRGDDKCTDWIATEKVHGSSFQFATSDGENVIMASRRRILSPDGSFLKCNLQNLLQTYVKHVKSTWNILLTHDRWADYVGQNNIIDENDEAAAAEKDEDDNVMANHQSDDIDAVIAKEDTSIPSGNDRTELRIYGELYGGGGVDKDLSSAVQKEILYADDFRFYVFGITVNRKWMTVAEMNDICREAEFPYYAVPVCEPKQTLEDLIEWIKESKFLEGRSRMTERTDDTKTAIEGVVMSPLTRQDYRFHPVKLLSEAFMDVKNVPLPRNKGMKKVYCTKARYQSVISKLDLNERADVPFVTDLFIKDIIDERGPEGISTNERKAWVRCVRTWLEKDGYAVNPYAQTQKEKKDSSSSKTYEDKCPTDNHVDDSDFGCFVDLFS